MKPRELVLALRAMGLTQKQIQQKTGIPQPTVSKIGLGRVNDVMSRHYVALLTAYESQVKEQKEQALRPAPAFGVPSPND
ncbi:XRE family transcriptional regulator [Variovorax sp. J22G73]|jgi:predicted transcriptional regulator|uniref:XRE family transcriptional regulator n=1 Tax=unclassified Variovorax TaxID=663243 RepID=UPI000D5F9B3E|nr:MULTISPECIES: XRE family transcriptional regulator [unclassified Variovorax]MDM0006481.1 XRE family transcriptional regulator [Variovorax sp. J22R203]MDM0097495.1 XRE family transcriptional regulator [Variovorax sp. J22G73]